MFGLRLPELLLIVLVILLLFGARKVPELMRGIGKGIKSFKDGMNEPSSSTTPEGLNKDSRGSSEATPSEGSATKE
ncbi:MAG: twin-arginine translocase TatA/TatE family subunit [Prevotellaceae bacterium]|nr:twin-arginine translocase TatA/TatE family subunit [Prevotellaceae bacterium]